MDERDIDAEFDAIVAGWDAEGGAEGGAEASDRGGEQEPPAPERPVVNPALFVSPWRAPEEHTRPEDRLGEAAALEDDEDEGFVPGPVTLPPQEDLHYWGVVAGFVIGPMFILYVVIARPFYAGWWLTAGIGLVAAAFGLLVLRSPRVRDEDDPDDGARV